MYQGTRPPIVRGTTWSDSIQCYDDTDNTPIDISQASEIEIQVRDGGCTVLTARLTDSTISFGGTTGVFFFDLTIPSGWCAKTYAFGCNVTLQGKVIPVAVGYLPIIDGHIL